MLRSTTGNATSDDGRRMSRLVALYVLHAVRRLSTNSNAVSLQAFVTVYLFQFLTVYHFTADSVKTLHFATV